MLLFGWFIYELFYASDRVLATTALGLAGVTDYLDGYIARHFNQMSEVGRFLDPAIDRMMTVGTLIAVMIAKVLPAWFALVVLSREVTVSVAALMIATKGFREIEVSFLGKLGTFGFMVALPLLVFGGRTGQFAHAVGVTGLVLIIPSAALAFVSAISYVPRIRGAWRAVSDI